MPMSVLLNAVTVSCCRSHVLKHKNKQNNKQPTMFLAKIASVLLARSHVHVNETARTQQALPLPPWRFLIVTWWNCWGWGCRSSCGAVCGGWSLDKELHFWHIMYVRNNFTQASLCLFLALWGCLSRTTLNKGARVVSSPTSWMLLLVWRLQGTFLAKNTVLMSPLWVKLEVLHLPDTVITMSPWGRIFQNGYTDYY